MSQIATSWRNWAGNQSFVPQQVVQPASEEHVLTIVSEAAARNLNLRVAGAGHSFTPVVQTDGVLLDPRKLSQITTLGRDRCRVVVGPGTTIGELGEPLLEAGLALPNQGDIVEQHIAGAVSTATHGSGLELGSFSSIVRRMRLATPAGLLEVNEGDPRLLHAAQVAVGMLGVITEIELEVEPAYRLAERIENWSWHEAWEQLEETARRHRHFSFFWMPSAASSQLYGLGQLVADRCYVRLYDIVDAATEDSNEPGRRVGPAHTIYPMVFEPNFHELEYFVPFHRGRDALAAMRELMLRLLPASVFPMEVRTVARDNGYLSHSCDRDSVVISTSGMPGTDYLPYLREVDRLLGEFDARVHWGKLHFLEKDQLLDRYPYAQAFIETRRALDPQGIFLNDHLRPLFE